MKATFISLTLLSILSPVLSHGIVNKITVTAPNGSKKTYKGNQFNQGLKQQFDSPIRQVKTNSPITDLNSADMACGIGAATKGAKLTAEVQAGSKIDFQWTSGSGNVSFRFLLPWCVLNSVFAVAAQHRSDAHLPRFLRLNFV